METYGLEALGIINPSAVYRNLSPAQLVEKALARGEGYLNNTGALCVNTGKYTGRSPNDKFIVDTAGVHDDIAWGKVNVPTTQEVFDALYEKMVAYLQNREVFIFDGFAGADPKYTKAFRIVNELASQNLFIHQLLLRPTEEQLANYKADFTIIAAPGFKCIPERDHVNSEAAIMIDYEKKMVLIAGSQYAGEIKKSVFSVMNYLMPKEGIFPMHCSANIGDKGDSAIFFGLSGTGKTTLSADPNRKLIGDDEHGWADDSVFNFEGGCYAKCIDLTEEREPEIFRAIKFGSLVENVIHDEATRVPDYSDGTLTENTRVGYPVDPGSSRYPSGTSPTPPSPASAAPPRPSSSSPPTPTASCPPSPSSTRSRPSTTSSPASPASWRAPSGASPPLCPPSPPASALPSCPSIPLSTPRCWLRRWPSPAPTSTSSTPAGAATAASA